VRHEEFGLIRALTDYLEAQKVLAELDAFNVNLGGEARDEGRALTGGARDKNPTAVCKLVGKLAIDAIGAALDVLEPLEEGKGTPVANSGVPDGPVFDELGSVHDAALLQNGASEEREGPARSSPGKRRLVLVRHGEHAQGRAVNERGGGIRGSTH
jgi:hypothetical protein